MVESSGRFSSLFFFLIAQKLQSVPFSGGEASNECGVKVMQLT